MKITNIKHIAYAMLLLLLASCADNMADVESPDGTLREPERGDIVVTLEASLPAPKTRLFVENCPDNQLKTEWEKGDKVYVVYGQNKTRLEFEVVKPIEQYARLRAKAGISSTEWNNLKSHFVGAIVKAKDNDAIKFEGLNLTIDYSKQTGKI